MCLKYRFSQSKVQTSCSIENIDTSISRMLTTGVIVRVFVVDKHSDIAVLKRFSKPPFSISDSFYAYSLRATACVFCWLTTWWEFATFVTSQYWVTLWKKKTRNDSISGINIFQNDDWNKWLIHVTQYFVKVFLQLQTCALVANAFILCA